ncbi:MAG: GGDEF domain-containing protein [Gammaproteobacteria bacterium]|nr:GGDEF domain-containing protein [Gammaproteobacteria bacterium]MCH9763180.1 GGDEF domain-containing protein [Gammaproteobacteria bacterium]
MALFDVLTNLPHRRYFLEHLDIVLKRASRRPISSFSVCFMDCDEFKQINDDHGHQVGDAVLKHIARAVSKLIRANDFFARLSGDEFCLVLEETTSEKDLEVTLNKILNVIATPFEIENKTILVTMSIGVAVYPKAAESADALLKHADEAMYAAKRNTKNTYVIY